MKQLALAALASGLFLSGWSGVKKEKMAIYFETDRSEISSAAHLQVQAFLESVPDHSDFEVIVQGHADSRGDLVYNDSLSRRRALEVKELLTRHGLKQDFIRMSYYGERQPLKPNNSHENLQENRRVDVILKAYHFEQVEDLESAFQSTYQNQFELDPGQKNVLYGKQGVRIRIPEHAFTDADGRPVSGTVQVEMIEALNLESGVAHGLSTISDGQLLISGGMFKLTATDAAGNSLQLAPGQRITASIPTANRDGDMQLFNSQNGDNWAVDESPVWNPNSVDMPPFPERRWHDWRLPKYSPDESDLPIRPIPPMAPRSPHEPREGSYTKEIRWYHLNKNKKRQQNEYRYGNAMERYDVREDRHALKMLQYKEAELEFRKNLATYEYEMDQWEKKEKARHDGWDTCALVMQARARRDSINQVYELAHQKKSDQWWELYRSKLDSMATEMEDMGVANDQFLTSYVFSMNELGWVNIDRFSKVPPNQRFNLTINDDNQNERKKVLLVFKNVNSYIKLNSDSSGHFKQDAIPKSEEAVIFAYKIENNRPMICYEPVNGQTAMDLKFRESSLTEIREILRSMNAGQKES